MWRLSLSRGIISSTSDVYRRLMLTNSRQSRICSLSVIHREREYAWLIGNSLLPARGSEVQMADVVRLHAYPTNLINEDSCGGVLDKIDGPTYMIPRLVSRCHLQVRERSEDGTPELQLPQALVACTHRSVFHSTRGNRVDDSKRSFMYLCRSACCHYGLHV